MEVKIVWPLLICLLFCGCAEKDRGENRFVVMSWNVQNFFDDVSNGSEYREFDPANGDWTYDCFTRKAAALADVIEASVPGGPDIVLLQEVENLNALNHLNDSYLKTCSYEALFLPTENSAVGCAVLSREPVTGVSSHAVNLGGEVMGRNITAVEIVPRAGTGKLLIFINHWKSKLGGAEATEPARIAAAELLLKLMTAAAEAEPGLHIIAAGDFNESHDESLRVGGAYRTAFGPDGGAGGGVFPSAGDAAWFAAAAEAAPAPAASAVYFTPWPGASCSGSYFYGEEWETIDQFFLGDDFFDGSGWEYAGFSTFAAGFNSTAEGLPLEWRTAAADGCSDHFPIMLELEAAE